MTQSNVTNEQTMPKNTTHEGALAVELDAEAQLRRSVMACLLWQNSFYEEGQSIAERIQNLVAQVHPKTVFSIALEARNEMKLRHVPLLIARCMARLYTHKHLVADTLYEVIKRPDEIITFLSMYWKDDPNQPLSAQVKKGLARAFLKFDAYQLAKYDRNVDGIRLRDAAMLCHVKPRNAEERELMARLINKSYYPKATSSGYNVARALDNRQYESLPTPDTWEVGLSSGDNKCDTFTRLIMTNKLGAMAFLKNLRNMLLSGVNKLLIQRYAQEVDFSRVLPYRFITAAMAVPALKDMLEPAMFKCIKHHPKMSMHTKLLIDVSGSMDWTLSPHCHSKPLCDKYGIKAEPTRLDVASALAILLRELCDDLEVYTFSRRTVRLLHPVEHGFVLAERIDESQFHGGTYLGKAVEDMNNMSNIESSRLIVITDEQSEDAVPMSRAERAYMINVSVEKNGVGYHDWIHIDGWSEYIIDYIQRYEEIMFHDRQVA